MGNAMRFIVSMLIAIGFTLFVLASTTAALGQGAVRNVQVIVDTPTITIATATADTTWTSTVAAHQGTIRWKFGTVTGSYTGCTVQAKTGPDGTNFEALGSAQSVTVATGQLNEWVLFEPASSTPSTTAQGFGQATKFTFACSGYGISAPVSINVTYTPQVAGLGTTSGTPVSVSCTTGNCNTFVTPLQGSFTDRGGSITTGGTSQTLAAANTARRRIVIQNPCTTTGQNIAAAESVFINFTSAASATAGTSFELAPCGSYDSGTGPVTTELITVVGATTSHKFVAKEQ